MYIRNWYHNLISLSLDLEYTSHYRDIRRGREEGGRGREEGGGGREEEGGRREEEGGRRREEGGGGREEGGGRRRGGRGKGDYIGDDVGEGGVALAKPATRSDPIGLVLELIRSHLIEVLETAAVRPNTQVQFDMDHFVTRF